MSNPKFYRAQPDDDAMLARQLLANDVRVPVVAKETLPKPIVQTIKCCPTHGLAVRNNATFTKISANRVARASKLLRNSFRSPASFVKAWRMEMAGLIILDGGWMKSWPLSPSAATEGDRGHVGPIALGNIPR
ncbi:hypothetical protein X745_32275 [Mesorhizobium sp. LNJC374B00]|nr:hypothetical protein X745_32275 [Mesorhizobium sp. LNJC374B00]